MLDYKLYTFLSLCKNMNYRVTAEKLNMTQPAVTNHIKQLENQYGCKLFEYKNRVLYKTNEAYVLENYALSADYNAGKLFEELQNTGIKKLSIGATRTIGDYMINSQLLSLLNKEKVELTFIVDNTATLIKRLRNGKLDFALIEGFINKDDFIHYFYSSEVLIGICSKNHVFANKEIDIKNIFNETIILREKDSGTREAFERILTDHNFTINSFCNIIQSNSFKTITELVSKNIGISFVYSAIAKKNLNFSTFKIKNVDTTHEFNCIHLHNTPRPIFLDYFLK